MKTYVVKNIDDFPILLQFTDGSKVKLRPNGLHVWQGPTDNMDFLQEYVDSGKLDVTIFEIDFTPYGLEPKPVTVEWLKEGF